MRPPRPEDAPRIAELSSLHSPTPYDAIWVEREWAQPGFDPERDARVDGDAYVAVWDEHDGKAWLDLQGEPTPQMLAWAEERARERGLGRVLGGGWRAHTHLRGLLEGAGYELVRHHYRMQIDLSGEPEAPRWPEGVAVRTFRPGDERRFYDVHQESFADHWEHNTPDPYDEWAHWLLQPPMFEPELWFLAEEAGEPAGIAICHRREEVPGRVHVAILGVRRPWRRRGVGRALLLHAFGELRRQGLDSADLGVDAASPTGATRLYERAGMRVVAESDTYEKQLA